MRRKMNRGNRNDNYIETARGIEKNGNKNNDATEGNHRMYDARGPM